MVVAAVCYNSGNARLFESKTNEKKELEGKKLEMADGKWGHIQQHIQQLIYCSNAELTGKYRSCFAQQQTMRREKTEHTALSVHAVCD